MAYEPNEYSKELNFRSKFIFGSVLHPSAFTDQGMRMCLKLFTAEEISVMLDYFFMA